MEYKTADKQIRQSKYPEFKIKLEKYSYNKIELSKEDEAFVREMIACSERIQRHTVAKKSKALPTVKSEWKAQGF